MSTANHQPSGKTHHYAHHYDSAEHEYDTSKQGIWAFLATEILMFGGLFVGYAIFHHIYPEVFRIGSTFTDWYMGAANTIVLLTSSLTMALGIYYIQKGKPKTSMNMLLLTILCGFMFMGIKYVEYSHKIHLGLKPGSWYTATSNPEQAKEVLEHVHQRLGDSVEKVPDNLALYFSFYYMMTGLHGIHVLIGMALIFWIWLRMRRGDFSPEHYTAVEGVGLFWHLVDLVWIYLFPLLYLVT
jgi:cytochrome c oxidase subunit 3